MLLKRKYRPFIIPEDARELTDEEMILVNGGSETTETHTVVSGDTLSEIVHEYNKNNGTNLTVEDVAKNSGISDPDKIYPGQTINLGPSGGASGPGSGSGSGGSGGNSGSPENTPSSPSSANNTNSTTSNTVKGPEHHSAYDQQYINEMMENARKNALGNNGIQGTAVTGQAAGSINRNINSKAKGAWEVKNKWTEEYIQKYREYAPKKIEEYMAKNMKFTCEDLGLSVLIDFASENNLPVTITNGSGKYSSSDPNFKSPEEFKVKVLSTTGAKDMLANTVGVAVHQLQAGDLICMDTGTPHGKQDGDYSHIQVITGKIGETLGIRQGNLDDSPFRTADYGSSSYAGMIIAGRAYDYGKDIFYGSERDHSNAQSVFGMSFRSWDFDRM